MKKKLINEAIFDKTSKKQIKLLELFIDFASKFLGLKKPKIILQFKHEGLTTTASYGNKEIKVYAKERALVDIMRSIAHEMVHLLQDIEGRLEQTNHDKDNAAGSPIENEANYKAGEIIRNFGEEHPEIYP